MAAVNSGVLRLYLSVYNWVIFFGWAQVLYNAILALLGSGHQTVYAAVEQPLLFMQTAAFMEILHAILGFVKSPISAIFPQISARLIFTWGVMWIPETHSHLPVTSLILYWSITDIIRYSFFGLKEAFGDVPYWLLWLRYSSFMVFMPISVVSEVGLIYAALPYMKASKEYCFRIPQKYAYILSEIQWRLI
ncbi:hypothetical protein EJB05_31541 [Eragrostis curvula]|uniref:Very-long-chain (3R)-3-hydroxyacyl-CoA dehydratase n=1 Tax=Eragrostis curvula TaxID=38414 RepID=A0A5J9UF93_9POAL|nr:hypothetical protein EJB05_31541 [Eragrostis curvula]